MLMGEFMNITIAAAQSASVCGEVEWNVARHLRFADIAAEKGVQLLVFPELSLIGYELGVARAHAMDPETAALDPLRKLAVEARMTIVAGAPLLNDQGQMHIAAFAFLPDGSAAVYTKEHVHSSEMGVFTSGPGGPELRVEDATVALAICADASHPQHAAKAAARGANVYAAGVMIDAAGYARKIPLLESYAREHRMAVLMANYSGSTGGDVSAGKSSLWSEDGHLVAAASGNAEVLVIGKKLNGAWNGAVLAVA
ncbi:MAG: carbon-nitrogen hydrolase family protein [Bryobacteraceae bacterium]|jgi:predicted amidohydrolase